MTKIIQESVSLEGRNYSQHFYQISIWSNSSKVDLRVRQREQTIFLKMSEEECEELIIRLQYALLQAKAAREGLGDD